MVETPRFGGLMVRWRIIPDDDIVVVLVIDELGGFLGVMGYL
jgi:hypothetical protein